MVLKTSDVRARSFSFAISIRVNGDAIEGCLGSERRLMIGVVGEASFPESVRTLGAAMNILCGCFKIHSVYGVCTGSCARRISGAVVVRGLSGMLFRRVGDFVIK